MSNNLCLATGQTTRVPNTEERTRRHKREHKKAAAMTAQIIAADDRFTEVGADEAVMRIALRAGFRPHDLVIARVRLWHTTVTAVIAPPRFWHRDGERARLFLLKRQLRQAGVRCLLISGVHLKRQPQLDNARLIASAARIPVSATERMAVELFLTREPSSSIEECARIICHHPDPFGAILRLLGDGSVRIRMNEPITPFSLIDRHYWPA